MIITFCGHSHFKKTTDAEQKILEFLEEKIGNQDAEIYLGEYGGFDNFAYDCSKKYKDTHSNVSLVFVTPYITENYQKNHLIYQQKRFDSIIFPPIEDKPLKFAIYYRNKYMIEKADYIIAYINHNTGGAYESYKHAKRKNKYIFNLGNICE
jgi:uncharacterized phage-like protein YoqJ